MVDCILRIKKLYPHRFDRWGYSMERIMGIEPTSTAWEAVVLPMNYIRVFCLLMYSTKICLKSQATKKDS